MQSLVLGNGESRGSLDISQVTCIKYGCNAIHRDFFVDHLICVDSRMVDEALKNPNTKNSKIYTRTNWIHEYNKYSQVGIVPSLPYTGEGRPDDPWHWGSGPYAVLIAAMENTDVHMAGFDLHGNDQLVNNLYKGTPNYLAPNKPKVDPSYWVYQIGKVFECFPESTFTVYNKKDWPLPREWTLSNVKQMDILDFTTSVADLQT